jgi:hypothetical protein
MERPACFKYDNSASNYKLTLSNHTLAYTRLGTTYYHADQGFSYPAQAEAAVLPNGTFSSADWGVIVPVGNGSSGRPRAGTPGLRFLRSDERAGT